MVIYLFIKRDNSKLFKERICILHVRDVFSAISPKKKKSFIAKKK